MLLFFIFFRFPEIDDLAIEAMHIDLMSDEAYCWSMKYMGMTENVKITCDSINKSLYLNIIFLWNVSHVIS